VLISICFSFLKGALERAVNHGGIAETPQQLYDLLCRHKPVNTTMALLRPRPLHFEGDPLPLSGIRSISYARFPEVRPAAKEDAGTERSIFFTCTLSPGGSAQMQTKEQLQSVHTKSRQKAMGEWLRENLEALLTGTETSLQHNAVSEAGTGCTHLCTAVVRPLSEDEKTQKAARHDERIAKQLCQRTMHQVALADCMESFLTKGSSQKAFVPRQMDVPQVTVDFSLAIAANAKSKERKPWAYTAGDNFGYKSRHAVRCNKPAMSIPEEVTEYCRRAFDLGNTKGHARRSAAAVHDELKRDGPLKRSWNLRAGFPEAKVKTMFSSLAQVRKKSQKKAGAAGVAAAGDNRGAAVGEEISDDVTATPQLACSGPFHLLGDVEEKK